MSAALKPEPMSAKAEDGRRAKAIEDASEARGLLEAGKLGTVVDRILDQYPKVMERLAK